MQLKAGDSHRKLFLKRSGGVCGHIMWDLLRLLTGDERVCAQGIEK
jgi:hypothetical protein